MRKSWKAFGISLGLTVLMMVGTITAYAEESTKIVPPEIVPETQQNGDALPELLDETITIDLWDEINPEIWIGEIIVNLEAVYDGSYVTITDVNAALGDGIPLRSQLKIHRYDIAMNNSSPALVWLYYIYRCSDNSTSLETISLTVRSDGTISIRK